jgi:hypothetical protein
MSIHSRVFWIGVAWCVLCLLPIIFLQHVHEFLYASGPAGQIGSLLVGIVGILAIVCGIILMGVSGLRGLYILIGSFVGIVLLYMGRFGVEPLLAHTQSVLTSLGVLSVALGGGISLIAIGILRESKV